MRFKNLSIFVVCILLIQGCGDSADKAQDYLRNGKTYFQKEEYDKARLEFKNALQIDSKLAEPYYYLALIAEKNQNWQGMFAKLSKTIKLVPDHSEALIKLGRLYLLSGGLDEALEKAEKVLKVSSNNIDAITLQGAVFFKQEQLIKAMEMADKALDLNLANVDAVSLKAALLMEQQNFSDALAVTTIALAADPKNLELNLLKLQIHRRSKNTEAIEKAYLEIINRFPGKLKFSYALAKFYADESSDDQAKQTLQAVIQKHKNKVEPKLVLIDLLTTNEPENAEKVLRSFIAEQPDISTYYQKLAALLISQTKFTEAEVPLNWLIKHKKEQKEGLEAKVLLAKLSTENGETSTASKLISEVLASDAQNFNALLMKARINLLNENYDQGISELRSILREFSESDEVLVLLAQAYIKSNSPGLAKESFRKALAINPGNFSAVMPIVSNMISSKDIDRADEVLTKALKIKPDHAAGLQALAQVKLLKKDWQSTQKIADFIATQPKGKVYSKYLSAKLAQERGLYEDAISKYKQVVSISPDFFDALRGILSCYEALGQRDKIFTYLNEFIAANPDQAYPHILKSQLYVVDENWNEALTVLNAAIEKWPKVVGFYTIKASVYNSQKDDEKVISSYQQGLDNIPSNTLLRMQLATRYEQAGDFDKALANYEILISENPNIDIAVNNLVTLLLDHFPSEVNIERAIKLSSRFAKSEQVYYLDTYGWSLYKSNKVEEALQVFKNVVSRESDVAVFRYHLGVANYRNNNKDLAIVELEKALELGKKQKSFPEQKAVEEILETLRENVAA